MKRKILSFVMAITFFVVCFGAYGFYSEVNKASAADTVSISPSVTSSYMQVTRELRVSYAFTALNLSRTDLCGGRITIKYDSTRLTLTEITGAFMGETISDGGSSSGTAYYTDNKVMGNLSIELISNDDQYEFSSLNTYIGLKFSVASSVVDGTKLSIQSQIVGYKLKNGSPSDYFTVPTGDSLYHSRYVYICEHRDGTEVKNIIDPTCMSFGTSAEVCVKCGMTVGSFNNTVPKVGHTYESTPSKILIEPTCTSKGRGYYSCSVCGDLIERDIPYSSHKFGSQYLATSGSYSGEYVHQCSVCGLIELAEDVTECNHVWEIVSGSDVLATPTTAGSYTKKCTLCGNTATVTVPAHTHTYTGGTESDIVPATCSKAGSKNVQCTYPDCHSLNKQDIPIDSGAHKFLEWTVKTPGTCAVPEKLMRTCEYCKTVEEKDGELAKHSYPDTWITVKNPTCTENGEEARTCTVCQNRETRSIEHLTHVHDQAVWSVTTKATCTSDGVETNYCTLCGGDPQTRVIPKSDEYHDYGEWETVKTATCQEDGEKTSTCSICGDVKKETIKSGGHQYKVTQTETSVTSICSTCGMKIVITAKKNGGYSRVITVRNVTVTVDDSTENAEDLELEVTRLGVEEIAERNTHISQYNEGYSVISGFSYQLFENGVKTTGTSGMKISVDLGENYKKTNARIMYLDSDGGVFDDVTSKRSGTVLTFNYDDVITATEIYAVSVGGSQSGGGSGTWIAIAIVVGVVLIIGAGFIVLKSRENRSGGNKVGY